jgi:phosphoribosylformylglycinamidine cyclo-ligase
LDYKSSGVDIEAGNSFVEKIKEKAPNIGGFNGMMKVPSDYKNPVLVSGADGVGTKINIARILNDYTTIGIDLVAMCVNDVITCGAKPLYFLDYISTGKLDQVILSDIIDGIIKGCDLSEMDLLGGETAEHPKPTNAAGIWDLDLAGFCTGIVEQDKIIDGSGIKAGDKIIGIESSGVHSNGYSLINDMIWRQKIYLKDAPELIRPTTIYAPLVKQLLEEVDILGMAHITGGGIPENLPRCLPPGLTADVDYNSWPRPQIFESIAKYGTVVEEEMRSIFNLGIGYCVVVSNSEVDNTQSIIERNGLRSWVIGKINT